MKSPLCLPVGVGVAGCGVGQYAALCGFCLPVDLCSVPTISMTCGSAAKERHSYAELDKGLRQ